MIYQVTYYRHDKKITETKPVKADTMAQAVQRLLDTAKQHNTQISRISCTIKGSEGVQRFCDTCQVKDAMFGIKGKFLCRECNND